MDKSQVKKILNTTLALLMISAEAIDDVVGFGSFSGRSGIYTFSRKMNMGDYQLKSALQSLERHGFIEKTNDQFLITPKGKRRILFFKLKKRANSKSETRPKWSGNWYIVIFDIPEKMRPSRDALRLYLKQYGFVRLQNSVFVSPWADFDLLDELRYEYKIEKYVNFLIAKSVSQDDDSLLKKKFNL